jgi:sulfonate transport system substrate-binding protein
MASVKNVTHSQQAWIWLLLGVALAGFALFGAWGAGDVQRPDAASNQGPEQSSATPSPANTNVVRITTGNVHVGTKLQFTGLTAVVVEQAWLQQELAARGVRIEWVPIAHGATGPLINEGFANQSIDIASYGDLPSIIANAAGIRTQLIVPNGRGAETYLLVPQDSTARSIHDLKGKRIAVHRGRPWELPLSRLIDSVGLTYDDFQILNLNPDAGAAALAAGKVDALVMINAHVLLQRGVGKILWSTAEAPPDWKMRAELWASRAFAEKNPELTQLVATAWVKAEHWASQLENRDAMLEILARGGAPVEVLEKEYGTGEVWKSRWSPLFDAALVRHYEHAIVYAAEKRIVRTTFPFDEIRDERFVARALQDLQLTTYWSPAAADEPIVR